MEILKSFDYFRFMKWLFCLLLSFEASAQVYVAFIEVRTPDGKLVQFEPGSRFAHSAISYKGYWLHSYPPRGVELTTFDQLQKIGTVTIVPLKNVAPLTQAEVSKYLGKPFDYYYSWNDDSIYCSELIAKLLRIKPVPMDFSAPIWPKNYKKFHGMPGMSPDGLARSLHQLTRQPVSCSSVIGI